MNPQVSCWIRKMLIVLLWPLYDVFPSRKTYDLWTPTQEIPYWWRCLLLVKIKFESIRNRISVQKLFSHLFFEVINYFFFIPFVRLQISRPVSKRHFYSSTKPTPSLRLVIYGFLLDKKWNNLFNSILSEN